MTLVLDTHALVWWISNPQRLSKRARDAISKVTTRDRLYVSSISVWEVALLFAKGRLKLTMDVGDWIARAETIPFIEFVPVDNHVALRATLLPEPFHNDPADRMIIATTLALGGELITKDQKIHNYPHVKSIW